MTHPDPNAKLDTSITVVGETIRLAFRDFSHVLVERVTSLLHPFYERVNIQDSYIQELTEQNQELVKRIEALEHERATIEQHTTE